MHSRPPDARRPRSSPTRRFGLSLLLLIPLFAGTLGVPAATADDLAAVVAERKAIAGRIQTQRQQVVRLSAAQDRVTKAIASTKKKLSGINANLSEVQQDVTTLRANIALVSASFGNLVDQLARIDRQLGVLQAEERRRQTALVERKALLGDRVRAAYAADRATLLETLLSSDSFADALAQVGYHLDFGRQDEALARPIVEDIRELSALHQEILGTKAETEVLRDEIASRKVELDAQLDELNEAEAKLADLQKKAAAALAEQRAKYDELAKNKVALTAAIAKSSAARESLTDKIDAIVAQKQREREQRIREAREREERERRERERARQEAARRAAQQREQAQARAAATPRPRSSGARTGSSGTNSRSIPSRYNGTLIWPLGGYVSQEYGCTGFSLEPTRGNCPGFHSGIDIVAPYGAPIRAAGAGEVVYVGWNYADGPDPAWIVVLAHSDGLQTWYAHMLPTAPVTAGQWVQQGQVIGYEGNTGKSTGAHLHWMVRANGAFLNPRLFV